MFALFTVCLPTKRRVGGLFVWFSGVPQYLGTLPSVTSPRGGALGGVASCSLPPFFPQLRLPIWLSGLEVLSPTSLPSLGHRLQSCLRNAAGEPQVEALAMNAADTSAQGAEALKAWEGTGLLLAVRPKGGENNID